MPYTKEFNSVLLTGWEEWDGSGVYSQPSKDFKHESGETWSVIVGEDGASFYNVSAELLGTDDEYDEGERFKDVVNSENIEVLEGYLSVSIPTELVVEIKQVYKNYLEYTSSWEEYIRGH